MSQTISQSGPAPLPRRHTDIAIVAGGVAGALLRAGLAHGLPANGHGWPWATFAVNVAGTALLGVVITLLHERLPASLFHRPLLGTGFCGALTTFSTLQLEAIRLVRHDEPWLAAGYLAGSLAGGLLSLWATTVAVRRFGPR